MEQRLVPEEDDSSSLDALRILRQLQSVGFCSDLDHNANKCFDFDHILSVFLKEIHRKILTPPFPAMLGDGKPTDLHNLYRLVSDSGGYDSVTTKKSWAEVAERMSLSSALGCPLKLVYGKYLLILERCLQRTDVKKSSVGDYLGCQENPGVTMSDKKSEVRSLFQDTLKEKKNDSVDMTLSPCSKRVHLLSPARKMKPMSLFYNSDTTNGSTTSEPKLSNDSYTFLKRKRETLVSMLNWVKCLAKNPIDPSTGNFLPSDCLKLEKNVIGEHYSIALQARMAFFLKKFRNEHIDAPILQIKKEMPPVYNSCNGASNQRLQPSKNPASLPDYLEDCVPLRIPLGSSFQAKISPCTRDNPETSCDSNNSKWLGERTWPHKNKLPPEANPIGKGREDRCKCIKPGSVECVRFHVAESRLLLKRNLGAAFYSWRFQYMGEEVALSWKEDEERMYKSTFRLNQQAGSKNFWKQLRSCFPNKEHSILVRYHFNVFLLALRSYQNRVSPNNIDSDDEQTGFGFLCCTFDSGAVRFHESTSIKCAQNLQCTDFCD